MIKLLIQTDGKDIQDSFSQNKVTLEEVALVIMRLEEMKKYLLTLEFESKFEYKEGCFTDED